MAGIEFEEDGMTALFVQLDVTWVDHPDLVALGMEARGVHAVALCLAKRLETDGWVDRALLRREGASDAVVDQLIEAGLVEADGSRVRPSGWHSRNPSQAAILASRASKSASGRLGNHRRYGHSGDLADCRICTPKAQVTRSSDRTGSQGLALASPETETETETITPHKSENHPDRDPVPSGEPSGEQAVRRAANLIGHHQASTSPGILSPAAYAAAVAKGILTGPDRERVERMLADGLTPETIRDEWGTALASVDRAPKVDGPDLKGLYEAQAVRTRAVFAEQHAAPRGDHRSGLAAARTAARTGAA